MALIRDLNSDVDLDSEAENDSSPSSEFELGPNLDLVARNQTESEWGAI